MLEIVRKPWWMQPASEHGRHPDAQHTAGVLEHGRGLRFLVVTALALVHKPQPQALVRVPYRGMRGLLSGGTVVVEREVRFPKDQWGPAVTQTSARAGSPGAEQPRSRRYRAMVRDVRWPVGVAAAYTVAQLLLVVPGTGLGWDETVYVSQVSPHAPAAFFSAPRARGITFLVAPVVALTDSLQALRVYLAVLSGAGLLLSMCVWRRLLSSYVAALAGALFAGLWITMLYGSQAMPNLWVAYGALIAVGCFLLAAQDRTDRAALAGLGAAVAFTALMRPGDAFWLLLPLFGAALSVRAWRRPAVLLVLVAGAALGSAEWVIEAYLRYGGLPARLSRAGEIQGHLGWHLAFDDHVRALQGRTLCRPCNVPLREPLAAAWWFVLPLLTAGGVVAAARARKTALVLVPTVVGLALAAPYLLLVGYAAPRFLLPAYALLLLPAALGLMWLAGTALPRAVVITALVLALAAHLTVQYLILEAAVSRSRSSQTAFGRVAAELRRQGLRPPCVVSGEEAVRVAFRSGCASRQTGGHDGSITPAAMGVTARSRPVAVLVRGDAHPPPYARFWRPHPLPALPGMPGLRAYLGPATLPGPAGNQQHAASASTGAHPVRSDGATRVPVRALRLPHSIQPFSLECSSPPVHAHGGRGRRPQTA